MGNLQIEGRQELQIEGGKYTLVIEVTKTEFRFFALRHGEKWIRIEDGSKMWIAVFHELANARARIAELEKRPALDWPAKWPPMMVLEAGRLEEVTDRNNRVLGETVRAALDGFARKPALIRRYAAVMVASGRSMAAIVADKIAHALEAEVGS